MDEDTVDIQNLLHSPKKFRRSLKNFELSNQGDLERPKKLNIHLITYDYVVRHQSWSIEPGHKSGLKFLRQITKSKTPFQRFGNDINRNSEWEQADLPTPTEFDFLKFNNRSKTPCNLYAGTELYGALEGLEHLLEKQKEDQEINQSTQITLAMDGLAERRPWWDADLSQPIDVVSGTAIKLPKSLGGSRIKHSGLTHQHDGTPKTFTDSNGESPWLQTTAEIRNMLEELSDSGRGNVVTGFIGQSTSITELDESTLNDYLFAPEADMWRHKNILIS